MRCFQWHLQRSSRKGRALTGTVRTPGLPAGNTRLLCVLNPCRESIQIARIVSGVRRHEHALGSRVSRPPVGGVDASAYERHIGRWSRLFVPALLSAADVRVGYRVVDVATGSGEGALEATSAVGRSGMMVGVDISSAMLDAAVDRMAGKPFFPVVANGESLNICRLESNRARRSAGHASGIPGSSLVGGDLIVLLVRSSLFDQSCLQSNGHPVATLFHIYACKPIVAAVILAVFHSFLDCPSSHDGRVAVNTYVQVGNLP
jgi:hypothetical protein